MIAVSLFGIAEKPVRATKLFGEPKGQWNVFASNSPNRMRNEQRRIFDIEKSAHANAVPRLGRRVERVVDRGCADSPRRHLLACEFVNGDVSPGRIGDRQLVDVTEAIALPGRVVMVHYRGASGENRTDNSTCVKIERNGAQIFDHDQIAVSKCLGNVVDGRRGRRVDLEPADESIHRALTGNSNDAVPKPFESGRPVPGDDADAVAESQAKRHDRTRRHRSSQFSTDANASGTIVTANSDRGAEPAESFGDRSRQILEAQWVAPGFTMPNADTYPWQWLWDSCFHAIAWAELGEADRALRELSSLFEFQADNGFVPHMSYHAEPHVSVQFWGRRGASTITQPPMFGHALADLRRRGVELPGELVDRATRGLRFLLENRRRVGAGAVALAHPWETGCDDSARWDGALSARWDRESWRQKKWDLLATVATDDSGAAIANPEFDVGSIGFNALLAFNAAELATVTNDDVLIRGANELRDIISSRWDPERRTWVDLGSLAESSGTVRTLDAHLALLVEVDSEIIATATADLFDPAAFGAEFGPAGCHRGELTFDADTYWRGPTWPQMSYLLWVGLNRLGLQSEAQVVADSLRSGAIRSGFSEYWNPDTGDGRGAQPQSWATIGVVVPG